MMTLKLNFEFFLGNIIIGLEVFWLRVARSFPFFRRSGYTLWLLKYDTYEHESERLQQSPNASIGTPLISPEDSYLDSALRLVEA